MKNHPHSGWFFIFGHSPNNTGCAQVRFLLACQPCKGLPATRKRVKGAPLSFKGDKVTAKKPINHTRFADKLKTKFSLFVGFLMKIQFRHPRGKSKFPL